MVSTTDNGDGTYTHTIETGSINTVALYAAYVHEGGPIPKPSRWQRLRRWVVNLTRWR